MLDFCKWLEATEGSVALRESIMVYPLVETTHVLTLALFFGIIALLDLRLLGLGIPGAPVSQFTRRLLPIGLGGFVIMAISGILLFYSGPLRAYTNPFFQVKMILIVLAGLNAGIFHLTIFRSIDIWDADAKTPPRARLAGALSLLFWSAVVICGRMQAYKWFQ